jgi:4-hydroxythreonine-4-phosphate dehydrogenase
VRASTRTTATTAHSVAKRSTSSRRAWNWRASQGYPADGPFPADTIFVRATRKDGGYDGVLTMYHDQGQIAMKLMGLRSRRHRAGRVAHPHRHTGARHGYDIAGRGIANIGAMRNAFALACKMGATRATQH